MKQITFTILIFMFSINVYSQYALAGHDYNNAYSSTTFKIIEKNYNLQNHNLSMDFKVQSYDLLSKTSMLSSPVTNDFKHYEKLYYKSKSNRNLGVMLTVIGVGLSTMAYFTDKSSYQENNIAGILLLGGGFAIDVGAFLWIYNGIKAHNNKEAMNGLR